MRNAATGRWADGMTVLKLAVSGRFSQVEVIFKQAGAEELFGGEAGEARRICCLLAGGTNRAL
ncbi:MAG TPA: hypothetical protein VKT32_06915 [Chthonomonadaceae bacterium]|nr:hypothetical protein [Chthonomonadaceae bacterium]